VPWEELLRLLEILSVVAASLKKSEDDLVSLLRRAAFRGVQFEAVEGFVPDEEEPEAAPPQESDGLELSLDASIAMPREVDLPVVAAGAPASFGYRPVPEKYLLALRAEESAESLPDRVVRLARELVTGEPRPPPEETALVLAELRDFLVADRRPAALAALLSVAEAAGAAFREALQQPLVRAEPLRTLLEAGPLEATTPDPALVPLFVQLGGSVGRLLVAELPELPPREAAIARVVLAELARGGHEDLVARIAESPPELARELFTVLVQAQPDAALAAAEALAAQGDAEGQRRVLSVLREAPVSERASRLLLGLLEAAEPELRAEAVRLVAQRKEPRGFDLLVKHAEKQASAGLTSEEAKALGEGLVALSPKAALPLLQRWCAPKLSLMARGGEQRAAQSLLEVGFAGLSAHPDTAVEALIKELGGKLDDEGKRLAINALHGWRVRHRG